MVAHAVVTPEFLRGDVAVQYGEPYDLRDLCQVSICLRPTDGRGRFYLRRTRTRDGAWPGLFVTRGAGGSRDGSSFGLWLPHVDDLTSDATLVPLAPSDRVHSEYGRLK